MGEDTLRETPVAKASEVRDQGWRGRVETSRGSFDRARCSWSVSSRLEAGHGSTLDSAARRCTPSKRRGPSHSYGVVVLLAVAAIFTLVFVFAVGAGVALAAGAAAAARWGLERRRWDASSREGSERKLDESGRKP